MTPFTPSQHGLPFANDFPPHPILTVEMPFLGKVNVGDASSGLCGGMVFAALDYFLAQKPFPPDFNPPAPDSSLDKYLRQRQVDSVEPPMGMFKCFCWSIFGKSLLPWTDRERFRMASLVQVHPVPTTLITVKTWNPKEVARNHQVLAYGYEECEAGWQINIYDPNLPGDDGVMLMGNESEITHPDYPVRGFYVSDYLPKGVPDAF